jgi:GH15 family glucan-1,4-alpha-glucosidase
MCGVTIQCKHNPYLPGEREVIERTGGIVIWPFVIGFTVLAALHIGADEFALDEFNKFVHLDGFGEWYDPDDGNKWGEFEQGWSAALYVRAFQALAKKGLIRDN